MKHPLILSVFLGLTGLSAAPAPAQDLTPVKTAELSARLYAAGVAAGDPLLVLAAAKLRRDLAPAPAEGRAPEGATAPASDEAPLGWEEMVDTALSLAAGDEAMVGIVEDVRAETTKGVTSGPVYNIGSLSAGGRDTYPPLEFRGGEYAEVYVEAKSSADLNLTVTDAQGRLVCSDSDPSHIAYCGWTPDADGTFVLRVENRAGGSASYALMTN